MKLLLILISLLMGACQLFTTDPQLFIKDTFPKEFQGYYTKISGDTIYDELQDEFKISENYMTYRDKTSFQESTFLTYIIEKVHREDVSDFRFAVESAYKDEYDPVGMYQFEPIPSQPNHIKVTYYTVSLIFPISATATYKKSLW